MSAPKLQIALRVPPAAIPIAGIPAAERTAHTLGAAAEVEHVVLRGIGADPRETLRADLPTVELSGEGLPDPAAFRRFAAAGAAAGKRTAWIWRGETIAVWFPAKDVPGKDWPPAGISASVPAAEEAWTPVRDAAEARAAEDRLFAALGKPTDGFLSRLDRRVSTALSRRLARTAVTPNQITWASIAVGLAGTAAIAAPGWGICLAGTLLVWLSAVLDGCDGEIARVKLLSSPSGARLDLFGDHVVNFATLAAIAIHVHYARPEWGAFGIAALLLLIGVAASAATVAALSVPSEPGRLDLLIERMASRDFVYLVIPLAALGRLDWFFWAAAVGSNVFWVSLWALRWRARARPRDTTSQSPA
jgi:phosphatidylglycerophosphate synthase